MRASFGLVAAVVASVTICVSAASVEARALSYYWELAGGPGGVSAPREGLPERGGIVRGGLGVHGLRWGFEAALLHAGQNDLDVSSLSVVAPLVTVRDALLRRRLDQGTGAGGVWMTLEVYGKAGPTYGWLEVDRGVETLQDASGPGVLVGGGLRFVIVGLSFSAELDASQAVLSPQHRRGGTEVAGDADSTRTRMLTLNFGIGVQFGAFGTQ